MISDCKIAIVKGTAVCSLRCHLGMLQILLKKASCHLTKKVTPLHIPQAVKPHSQMLLELTPDVFIQPIFIHVLPLHSFSLCRRLNLIPSNHRPFLSFWGNLCPMEHIRLAFPEVSWAGPEWCTLHSLWHTRGSSYKRSANSDWRLHLWPKPKFHWYKARSDCEIRKPGPSKKLALQI